MVVLVGGSDLLWHRMHHDDVVGGLGSALFLFGRHWWVAMAFASVGSVALMGDLSVTSGGLVV